TAYLVTGLGLAAAGLFPAALTPVLRLFADFGIALLLFLVGLEINFSALRRVGWAALLVGFAQVCITFVAGFIVTLLLGFSPTIGAYIALAVTFSSTVVVVKLLSEKKELNSLVGKMTLGILLTQDMAAIAVLVVLGAGVGHGALVP